MYGRESRMFHDAAMANIGTSGSEVLPVIRDWQQDWAGLAAPETNIAGTADQGGR